MFDFAIIGAGIVGSMIARELSRYENSIIVLEKEEDVAKGSSGANSGIVHAGFDAKPGTLKARLNVEGAARMPRVAEELGVAYHRNGSLVVAFHEGDMESLRNLYARGVLNGVPNLELIDAARLHAMEPNISSKTIGALYAPSAGIICPYSLTVAAMGNAMDNGVFLQCDFPVEQIVPCGDHYQIISGDAMVEARIIINAAGIFADDIGAMVGDRSFSIHPRRGEYLLFDQELGYRVHHTVFQAPTPMGKGVLVTPTAHGNLMIGPNAEDLTDKEDLDTTTTGQSKVIVDGGKTLPSLSLKQVITTFAGLRAVGSTGDFIIGFSQFAPRFLHVAGIESPGLASSPAIAAYVTGLLRENGYLGQKKSSFDPCRHGVPALRTLPDDVRQQWIEKDPHYGKIVCRCEEISEGEIIDAIHRNPPATTVDGVKRRTRSGMGRCQGGFCLPSVTEILSRELGIPMEQVTKKGYDSAVLWGRTK